ncbi:NXPE family member 3-like [Ptychodera flava]|uniref:NXPE family member 3-like n=1 Tax=Ptychodera flava TaxID=63121 RepID=UPI00396A1352
MLAVSTRMSTLRLRRLLVIAMIISLYLLVKEFRQVTTKFYNFAQYDVAVHPCRQQNDRQPDDGAFVDVSFSESRAPENFPKTHEHIRGSEPPPFPVFRDIGNVTHTSSMGMTDPNKTTFFLKSDPNGIFRGDIIHFQITAKDERNRPRIHGGDFWYAVMGNDELAAGTVGKVVDYDNGTYSVYFYAGWQGFATVKLVLVHTREAGKWLRDVVWLTDNRAFWTVFYKSGHVMENSTCTVQREGIWNDKCEYPVHMYGKTVILCDKPESLSCRDLYASKGDLVSMETKARSLRQGHENVFRQSHIMVEIGGNIEQIRIHDRQKRHQSDHPSTHDIGNSSFSGYWLQKQWFSTSRDVQRWDKAPMMAIKRCLAAKSLLFVGESTARQFCDALVQLMGIDVKAADQPSNLMSRNIEVADYNITVKFKFHSWPLGSKSVPVTDLSHEADMIDSLGGDSCDNHIVLVSSHLHFPSWTKHSYMERVVLIKSALYRLKSRCPGTIAFVKGSKPRDHGNIHTHIHSSDYILFEMNKILEEMFRGTDVHFLDVWDMNLAYPAARNVHMPETVIRQEVAIFLSTICPK